MVLGFDQTMDGWLKGSDTSAQAADAANHALPDMILTRDALAVRKPFPAVPQALDDYRQSTNLYIEGARIAAVAATLPAGPLQTQEELASLRVRDLGDSMADHGQAIMKPYLTPQGTNDITFVPAPEVPEWAALQPTDTGAATASPAVPVGPVAMPLTLAVGEPLDSPAPALPVQRYQTSRPQQAVTAWVDAVKALKLPSAAAEAAAVSSGAAGADEAADGGIRRGRGEAASDG